METVMMAIVILLLLVLCILIRSVIVRLDKLCHVDLILMNTLKDICNAMLTEDGKISFIQKMIAAFYEKEFEGEKE